MLWNIIRILFNYVTASSASVSQARLSSDLVDQPDQVLRLQSLEARTQSANMRPTCGMMMALPASNSGSRADEQSPSQHNQQQFRSMWTDQAVPQRDFFRQMFQPPPAGIAAGPLSASSGNTSDVDNGSGAYQRQYSDTAAAPSDVQKSTLSWVSNALYKPSVVHGRQGAPSLPGTSYTLDASAPRQLAPQLQSYGGQVGIASEAMPMVSTHLYMLNG